jgi:hypothetical protein
MHAHENAPRIAVIGDRPAEQHEGKRRNHERHLRDADARRRLVQHLRHEVGKDDELYAEADEPARLSAEIEAQAQLLGRLVSGVIFRRRRYGRVQA